MSYQQSRGRNALLQACAFKSMRIAAFVVLGLLSFWIPGALADPVQCLDEPDVKDQADCAWTEFEDLQEQIFDEPLTHAHASFELVEVASDGCEVADLRASAAGGAGTYAWSLTLTTPSGFAEDQDTGVGHPSPIIRITEGFTLAIGESISGTAHIHNVNVPVDNASDV